MSDKNWGSYISVGSTATPRRRRIPARELVAADISQGSVVGVRRRAGEWVIAECRSPPRSIVISIGLLILSTKSNLLPIFLPVIRFYLSLPTFASIYYGHFTTNQHPQVA